MIYDAETSSWTGRIGRAADLEPFVDELVRRGSAQGLERCGEDRLCLGSAVLAYQVHPLLTPDRKGIAEAALDQAEESGVRLDTIARTHPGVLAFDGSTEDGRITGRIVPARGWIFLVMAADDDGARPPP